MPDLSNHPAILAIKCATCGKPLTRGKSSDTTWLYSHSDLGLLATVNTSFCREKCYARFMKKPTKAMVLMDRLVNELGFTPLDPNA